MIQTGWPVSDSLLILYVKTKTVTKWWLTNISSNIAIWQYIAICYKAIRNMVFTCIVASLQQNFTFESTLYFSTLAIKPFKNDTKL